jgi:membrane protein DedA with SNARE-associated domain
MAYAAVFLLALLEALAVIGLVIPGTTGVAAIGAAAEARHLSPVGLMAAATVGAVLGDGLSYFAGCNLHAWKRLRPFFERHALALQRTHRFIERWGVAAIIFARFFGPARAFAPLVAGTAGMPVARYAIANVAGAIAWSFVFVTIGEQAVAAWDRLPHTWLAVGAAAVAAAWLGWKLLARRRQAPPT